MHRILVKGTFPEALARANEFGIRILGFELRDGELLADADAGENYPGDGDYRFQSWFRDSDSSQCIPGLGFPGGTLLHYSRLGQFGEEENAE